MSELTPADRYRAFAAAYSHLPGLRQVPDSPILVPNTPEVWGPPKWRLFHATTRTAAFTPAWLEEFTQGLPALSCACQAHWKAILDANPPPWDAGPEERFAWGVARHNEVNRKLLKPELTLDAAQALYPPPAPSN